MKLDELRLRHAKLDDERAEIYNTVDEKLSTIIKYKGIKCHVTSFDLDSDYVIIHPVDGESVLSERGKHLDITFSEYDELTKVHKYKIHFYKGMEAFGQVLEHFKTVEVDIEGKPLSENEIILEGLKKVGTYPKSYTAKVYKINT